MKKVIYYLDGGLGNQLFQLMHINEIKKRNEVDLNVSLCFLKKRKVSVEKKVLDFLERNKIQIEKSKNAKWHFYIFKILRRIHVTNFFYFQTEETIVNRKKKFISGIYQDVDYNYVKKMCPLEKEGSNRNDCFIHIRGGDYLTNKNKKIYSILDYEYYKKSILFFNKNFGIKEFRIYTNDNSHALSITNSIPGFKYEFSKNKNAIEDFEDMSSCRYGIISNSTFAFWASMNGTVEEKVIIAPNKWYNRMDYPNFIDKKWKERIKI